MKTKKRILSIMLTLTMLLSMMSAMTITASAEEIDRTDWTEMTSWDTSTLYSGKYYLNSDMSAYNIFIEEGNTVTLDLNGHVLDAGGNDKVIYNSGVLTLIDSHPTATHTGDYAGLPEGGVVTGGVAVQGAGIFNNGTLTMNGGTVYGNSATISGFSPVRGAGIFNYGTFTMNGGAVSGNKMLLGQMAMTKGQGGGVYNAGTFNMTGGTISDNTVAIGSGAGVFTCDDIGYSEAPAVFNMSGGMICNNTTATQNGAGGVIFLRGSMTVGGTAVIKDNLANTETSDLRLDKDNKVMLAIGTGASGNGVTEPKEGMKIGVIKEGNSYSPSAGVFATSATLKDTKYFFSDSDDYGVRFNEENDCLELTTDPTFDMVAIDSGYYATAENADTKTGIIAFTAFFSNLETTYKDIAFDKDDVFGITMFGTESDADDKSGLDVTISKNTFSDLRTADGYFYSFIKNINSTKFGNSAYAIPFAIVNGTTYWGNIVSTSVNGEGTPKWLGPVAIMPE